jgi:anti-anti-sigma factor
MASALCADGIRTGFFHTMDIRTEHQDSRTLLSLTGRLDGQWSDHLDRHIGELVRTGRHRLALDLSAVEFLSSAGIRALVSAQRQLGAVNGSLTVVSVSEPVDKVLSMVGLRNVLVRPDPAAMPPAPAPGSAPTLAPLVAVPPTQAPTAAPPPAPQADGPRRLMLDSGTLDLYTLAAATMTCAPQGEPQSLAHARYTARDAKTTTIGPQTVSLGLGAFGNSFDDCQGFFGEYLAVCGAAVSQPAERGASCDFLVAQGDYLPEVQTLYSLTCTGAFSHLIRFDPPSSDGKASEASATRGIELGELARQALALTDSACACIVLIAESAGLIGASLRRSPAEPGASTDVFEFPGVRDWLSFSTERLDAGSTVVAVGIVGQAARLPEALAPFMRPMGVHTNLVGHVHGAPFKHRPLPRGVIDLATSLRPLFDSETAATVMHLLCDDRNPDQIEDSRFLRGACWAAPLH